MPPVPVEVTQSEPTTADSQTAVVASPGPKLQKKGSVLDAGLSIEQKPVSDIGLSTRLRRLSQNGQAQSLSRSCSKEQELGPARTSGISMETKRTNLLGPYPANSKFLSRWDPVVMSALCFTALVTPYEVALLDTSFDPLFVVNRLIDSVFVVDMILQCLVEKTIQTPDGTITINTHKELAKGYLRGWFVIDFVSILPFDLVGFLSGSAEISKMKTIRLLRLARLLKLLRILRASRIISRWQTRISVSFGVQKMCSLFAGLLITSHWMACIWALVGRQAAENGQHSFLQQVSDSKQDYDTDTHWHAYLVAAHMSVCTIKATHGWGVPQNEAEYYLGTLSMWVGGLVWTYTIGQFCGVVANLSPDQARFQQNMDALNRMMEYKSMPMEMRYKLRGYFIQARELHMANAYTGLLNQMSPVLQAEVAHTTNRRWLVKVWYLAECTDEFAAKVAQQMGAAVFCPEEIMIHKIPKLCIVSRGLVGRFGRLLRKGRVYGEDFILTNPKLRQDVNTFCFTYVEILSIDQTSFLNLVKQASVLDAGEVRLGFIQLAVTRGIIRLAELLSNDEQLRRSFLDGKMIDSITDHQANGASPTNRQMPSLAPAQTLPSENFGKEAQTVSNRITALESRLNEKLKEQAASQTAAIERLRKEHQESTRAIDRKLDQIATILSSKHDWTEL